MICKHISLRAFLNEPNSLFANGFEYFSRYTYDL